MPFQKNNKLGAKRLGEQTLEKAVIAFRGRQGQKEGLKNVPDWQERLRDYVDFLLDESGQSDSNG